MHNIKGPKEQQKPGKQSCQSHCRRAAAVAIERSTERRNEKANREQNEIKIVGGAKTLKVELVFIQKKLESFGSFR